MAVNAKAHNWSKSWEWLVSDQPLLKVLYELLNGEVYCETMSYGYSKDVCCVTFPGAAWTDIYFPNMTLMISQKYDSIKVHFGEKNEVIGATYASMDQGTTHLSIGDDHEIFNL